MNIGDTSAACGLPVKTIRYYEDIGLIRPARGNNGYRDFSETDAQKLAFLSRARSLGFSIEDCRSLISLYEDRERASSEVKQIASEHLDRIAQKIAELESLQRTLSELVTRCDGNDRPNCPIIDNLAGEKTAGSAA